MRDMFKLGKGCSTCKNSTQKHFLVYKGHKYILDKTPETKQAWESVEFEYRSINPLFINLNLEKIYKAGLGKWRRI